MELRRILSLKRIIIIVALCILNCVLFASSMSNTDKKNAYDEQKQADYINSYYEHVDNVVGNADNLLGFTIFQTSQSNSYADIIKTKEDYERFLDIDIKVCSEMAMNAITEYDYVFYLCGFIMIIIVYAMLEERDNRMWNLTYTAKKGRFGIGAKRCAILVVSAFCVLFVNIASVVIMAFATHRDYESLLNPIQALKKYADCTYMLNSVQYIMASILIGWIALVFFSFLVMMIFIIMRNRKNALLMIGIITGLEFLLYKGIDSKSIYHLFKEINIINMIDVHAMLQTYNNIQLFGYIYSYVEFILICMVIVIIACMIISVLARGLMRPEGRKGIFDKFYEAVYRLYQRLFARSSVIFKEFHKLVFSGKSVYVILTVIVLSAYFINTGFYEYSDYNKRKEKLYAEHGGEDYSYILDEIDKTDASVQEAVDKYQAVLEKFNAKEADLSEVMSAYNEVNYQRSSREYYNEYTEKMEYLNELKDTKNIQGFLMSDRGYEQLIGKQGNRRELVLLAIFVAGIVIINSQNRKMEIKTGMRSIVRASVRGRTWISVRRAIADAVLILILYLYIYGLEFVVFIKRIGIELSYINAPVQSLTFMEDYALRISIAQYITIKLIINLAIGIFAAIITRIDFKKK